MRGSFNIQWCTGVSLLLSIDRVTHTGRVTVKAIAFSSIFFCIYKIYLFCYYCFINCLMFENWEKKHNECARLITFNLLVVCIVIEI